MSSWEKGYLGKLRRKRVDNYAEKVLLLLTTELRALSFTFGEVKKTLDNLSVSKQLRKRPIQFHSLGLNDADLLY